MLELMPAQTSYPEVLTWLLTVFADSPVLVAFKPFFIESFFLIALEFSLIFFRQFIMENIFQFLCL